MEKDLTKQMKRIQILLLLTVTVLVFFGSCGIQGEKDGSQTKETTHASENEDLTGLNGVEANGEIEDSGIKGHGDSSREEDLQVVDPLREVSDRRTEVVWQGGSLFKSLAEVGKDGIYLVYMTELEAEERYLGRIPAEETQLQDFGLMLGDGMFAVTSCLDTEGNWHVLVIESGNDSWEELWVIDSEGRLVRTVDFSEIRKNQEMRPFCMAVDKDGNYYLDDMGKLVIVDGEGSLKWRVQTRDVAGLGTGKSGQVYGVFFEEDSREMYLAGISPEDGSLERCDGGGFGSLGAKFSSLSPGVNCELLLANKAEGAWEYRDGELTQVLWTSDLPCNGQDILAMGFLDDGRLCVMEYREGTNVFHYIPAERQP